MSRKPQGLGCAMTEDEVTEDTVEYAEDKT